MIVTFRIRRDTAANWTSTNPVLALGEPGLETDTRRVKYGDGTTAWTALAYSGSGAAWGQITGTLSSQTDLVAALAAAQPLDSDLTAIAALTTTSTGRDLLTAADAAAIRTKSGLGNVENKSSSTIRSEVVAAANTWTAAQTFNGRVIVNQGQGTLASSMIVGQASATGYTSITFRDERASNSFVGQFGLYGSGVAAPNTSNLFFYNTAGGGIGFYVGNGNPTADLRLLLGTTGVQLPNLGNYASDAAAATAGVPINGVYRNGSALMIRVT